ncbi:MAG: hypothetical protein IK145_05590 [Bacteroidales bacterium]|nr:hypothetical protein [Bacteroidales bacterium]
MKTTHCISTIFPIGRLSSQVYRKLLLSLPAAMVLLMGACNKLEYNAQFKFDVSDEFETRAILNGHSESGADITWEEGDEIIMSIEIYQDGMRWPLNTVDGKLVYEEGKWKTYKAKGSSFVEKESISVSSPFLNSKVRIRFQCNNGDIRNPDANTFSSEWVRTIPFTEGLQSILVTLPF